MITPDLHKEPKALDTVAHRGLKLIASASAIERIEPFNSFMISIGEFTDCAREFPIVFVKSEDDKDGKPQVAPVAVFGLQKNQNLFVEKGAWTAEYLPAILRAYPFTLARLEGDERYALVYDASWKGFSLSVGQPLFDDKGEGSKLLKDVYQFVQNIEQDLERTRQAGQRLLELNLLQPMRFDATLPDGATIAVDGFWAVDEKRLAELSDAETGELHRSGLLALLYVHRLSMINMRKLVERIARRAAAQPAAAANDGPATPA